MSTSSLFGLPSFMAVRVVALIIGGLLVDRMLYQSSSAESYSDVAIYSVVAGILAWMATQARKRGETPIAWASFLVACAVGLWVFHGLLGSVLMIVRERDWFDPFSAFFWLPSLGASLVIMLTPLWFAGRWARRHGIALALYLAAVYLLPIAVRETFQGALMFTYSRGFDFTLALSAVEAVLFVASVGLLFAMILRLQRPGPVVNRNLLVGALVLVFSMPLVLTFAYTGYGLVQGSRPLSDVAGTLFRVTAVNSIFFSLPLLIAWFAARRSLMRSTA